MGKRIVCIWQELKKSQDKVGKRYGMLTVLEPLYKKNRNGKNKLWYNCKCDCGVEKEISNSNLRKLGGVRSCGCNQNWGNRAKDITGQKFGNLTAIKATEKRTRKSIVWEFKCDCGETKEISCGEVINLKTKSCGCLRRNPDREDAAWKRTYQRALRWKDMYGDDCNIDEMFFKDIVKRNCAYCGAKPSTPVKDGKLIIDYRNGMDRVDPDLGYTKNNVLPCCDVCNRAKSDMSYYEWVNFIARTYKNFVENNKFMELVDPNYKKHQVSMIFPTTKKPTLL